MKEFLLLLLLLVADNKETFAVSESHMEWLLGFSISGGGVVGRDLSVNLPKIFTPKYF